MKWNEVLQKYFKLSQILDTDYVRRKYTIKDNPITIKGHNYEKDLDQHSDFELNDVVKIEYLIFNDEYIHSCNNPTHVIMVYSSIAKLCTFEMLGDRAVNSWDLKVITDNED